MYTSSNVGNDSEAARPHRYNPTDPSQTSLCPHSARRPHDRPHQFAAWPCNDLWNLLPSAPAVNRSKGDRLPAAEAPWSGPGPGYSNGGTWPIAATSSSGTSSRTKPEARCPGTDDAFEWAESRIAPTRSILENTLGTASPGRRVRARPGCAIPRPRRTPRPPAACPNYVAWARP